MMITSRMQPPVRTTFCHIRTSPRVAILRSVISKKVAAMPVPKLKPISPTVSACSSVKDEPEDIRRLLTHFIQAEDTDAILLSGGTGLSPRDGTYEVVQSCLEKELTGFGELFRYLSYAEIGAAAMMSRATAGVARGTVIVSMPGSSAAVRLAMEKLILPELAHMTHIARG